jgi:hypothetical protein
MVLEIYTIKPLLDFLGERVLLKSTNYMKAISTMKALCA